MSEHIIEAKNLFKRFGGLIAVNNLNFKINRNVITSIIGPNGAGKTTLFNLISGYYWPSAGEIKFESLLVNNRFPYQLAALGIARTFQTASYFPEMTVEENMVTAYHVREKAKLWHILGRTSLYSQEEVEARENALETIEFLNIAPFKSQVSQKVPTAIKQLLGIGMALMTKPCLILLDEPSTGMTIEEVQQLMKLIVKIKNRNITVMLIEHRMRMVMGISDNIIVLNFGEKIAEGTSQEIRHDRSVIEAYLGKEYAI
jgi:branched-chain amino acid transport system ATP-binding protein